MGRIDLRITFRVNIHELAGYLASSQRNIQLEKLPDLTVKQIREHVRDEMEQRGTDGLETWSDQFCYDETSARLNIAARQIRRAFPELDKTDSERKQPADAAAKPALKCDWCSAEIRQNEGVSFVGELICQRCYHKHGLSQRPAASEPSDTCSVCGKEECANEVCGTEATASATCRHGNIPRPDVTGDPVKACEDGFNAPGHVEFGAFNPEGCFYSGDGCAVDAANVAVAESEECDDVTWGRMCSDHSGESADHCAECNAEPAPTCTDCAGSGCHWCDWTGKRR